MAKNKVNLHLPKTCEGRRISIIEIHVYSNTCANEQENKFHVYKIWIHKCIVISGFVQKDDKLSANQQNKHGLDRQEMHPPLFFGN